MNKLQNRTAPVEPLFRAAQPHKMWGWLYIVIASLALIVLALAAHAAPYFDFDLTITRAVQSIHAGWFDGVMRAIGWPGYPPQTYVWTVVIFLILFFYVSRWSSVAFIFAAVGVGAFGLIVKLLVDRPRPSADLIQVWNASLDGGKYSFTAGHVQVYVAVFGFLLYLAYVSQNRSWARTGAMILCGVLIALIGLARIDSGEHWFSDVVGGYLVGTIWLVLTVYFYRWGESRFFVRARPYVEKSAAETI
jgi:membrane-associated phospholipid phosphatase